MPNRAWLERLALLLGRYTGKPVVLVSQKGATWTVRDVRDDGAQITVFIQADR